MSIYLETMLVNVWVAPPTLAIPNFYVTNVFSAFCSLSGLKTIMIRIFWKVVSFSHTPGNFFSGYSLLFHSSNYLSLKFTCLANFGKLKQKLLNIYWRSKVDQEGKITLFSKGGGIRPVKNSHYWADIYCGKIPLSKNNPNASLSFLNKALEMLLNTILLT